MAVGGRHSVTTRHAALVAVVLMVLMPVTAQQRISVLRQGQLHHILLHRFSHSPHHLLLHVQHNLLRRPPRNLLRLLPSLLLGHLLCHLLCHPSGHRSRPMLRQVRRRDQLASGIPHRPRQRYQLAPSRQHERGCYWLPRPSGGCSAPQAAGALFSLASTTKAPGRS